MCKCWRVNDIWEGARPGKNMKKRKNVLENITTREEMADHTGHTAALLTKNETIDLVSDNERWVFAGGQMVEPEELAEADWSTVGTVRVMPRIVFG